MFKLDKSLEELLVQGIYDEKVNATVNLGNARIHLRVEDTRWQVNLTLGSEKATIEGDAEFSIENVEMGETIQAYRDFLNLLQSLRHRVQTSAAYVVEVETDIAKSHEFRIELFPEALKPMVQWVLKLYLWLVLSIEEKDPSIFWKVRKEVLHLYALKVLLERLKMELGHLRFCLEQALNETDSLVQARPEQLRQWANLILEIQSTSTNMQDAVANELASSDRLHEDM